MNRLRFCNTAYRQHIAGMIMAELKVLHPEWESVPYQVKRTAVRDACRAMSNVKAVQPAADGWQGPRCAAGRGVRRTALR